MRLDMKFHHINFFLYKLEDFATNIFIINFKVGVSAMKSNKD